MRRYKPCNYEARKAFALAHGRAPALPLTIDHIDRDTSNNRPENLRPATWRLQALNQSASSTRGLPRGVNIDPRYSRPYHVRMWVDGKRRSIGHYATVEEASSAYEAALAKAIEQEERTSWELFYSQKEIAHV